MAEAFKILVGYLRAKLLAHADVFLGPRQLAGTKALLAAKTLANFFYNLLVRVKIYFQKNSPPFF
jgi:hypothetical protein